MFGLEMMMRMTPKAELDAVAKALEFINERTKKEDLSPEIQRLCDSVPLCCAQHAYEGLVYVSALVETAIRKCTTPECAEDGSHDRILGVIYAANQQFAIDITRSN